MAEALICSPRGVFSGYSTARAAVILPPLTVICTWTGPYGVSAASPVTVFAAALPLGVPDGADAPDEADAPDPADPPDPAGVPPELAMAAGGEVIAPMPCVLNDSRRTRT